MNEDTRKLLAECNRGCKMAVESIHQTEEFVQDGRLLKILDSYKKKHAEMEEESAALLDKSGQPEKDQGMAAAAMSWLTTEVKLMMNDDNQQIAKLMMDGCSMGIQSISKCQNQYTEADRKSVYIARRLVNLEEKFMEEMKKFL